MTITDVAPPTLAHEHVFDVRIDFADRWRWGPTLDGGHQGYTSVGGGLVSGPRLQGRVVPASGADYASVRQDGVIVLNAHYLLEASDGSLIYIYNKGYVVPSGSLGEGGTNPLAQPAYFRCAPTFTVAAGPHDWLSRTVIVGAGVRKQNPDHSIFHYYALT
jgi:hypothetical protein